MTFQTEGGGRGVLHTFKGGHNWKNVAKFCHRRTPCDPGRLDGGLSVTPAGQIWYFSVSGDKANLLSSSDHPHNDSRVVFKARKREFSQESRKPHGRAASWFASTQSWTNRQKFATKAQFSHLRNPRSIDNLDSSLYEFFSQKRRFHYSAVKLAPHIRCTSYMTPA